MIRLARPEIGDEEVAAAATTLKSGQLVQGPVVAGFERDLETLLGARHVVAVSNGTAALHLALVTLGVGPGDRVALPTFSFPATANAVELVGARPVFIDIEPTTFGMDPDRLVEALERDPAIKAIMPVHAFGRMAQMDRISVIARERGIPIIEDAACALGAAMHGIPAGRWGALGCFSFHPRKAVTTGEGGAVVAARPEDVRQLRALRNHGMDPEAQGVDFILPGFNYRLSEVQAAVGREQLKRLEGIIATRRRMAASYNELLAAHAVETPSVTSPEEHVFQSYVVLLPPEAAEGRSQLIADMRAAGVETTIGTYHMPGLTYYTRKYGDSAGVYPTGENIARRAMTLPLHAQLAPSDQEKVVEALARLL